MAITYRLSLVLGLIIIMLSANTFASESEYRLSVEKIIAPKLDYAKAGDPILFSFKVHNTVDLNLDELKITVIIDELDIRRRIGPFELLDGNKETKKLIVDIPEYAKSGEYLVRIVAFDGHEKSVKHRMMTIV